MQVHRAPQSLLSSCALAVCLGAAIAPGVRPLSAVEESAGAAVEPAGARIWRERCVSCHGAMGEGVSGKHERPLVGDKSIAQLTRYIDKSMPDDAPEECVGEDAASVARHIYEAFYSPIAQARLRPPRIELSRLTVRQYRNAVADVIAGIDATSRSGDSAASGEERGLRGEYFNSRRPGERRVLERIDPGVRFDFGRGDALPEGLDPKGFSARWEGSLLAPETGSYELIVHTDHAMRLWINDPDEPLIDAWVKSGDDTEFRGTRYLLGGRAYPIRLDFTSQTQGVQDQVKKTDKALQALVRLEWRVPKRVAEVIPPRVLSPVRASRAFVVTTPFPPDDRSEGYERGVAVTPAWDEATTEAAIEVAGFVASRIGALSGARRNATDLDERARDLCARFVERAFRRPLDEPLRRAYVDRHFEAAPDLDAAVKRVVLLALKSPRFLCVDLEGETADPYGIASRLSFSLWDSIPDAELLAAAARGDLAKPDEIARQARRMIADPRARSKLLHFFHCWLDIDPVPELAKDPGAFPDFDAAVAADLRTSLDLSLDDALASGKADFRALLLSKDLFLNGRLARFYGLELPADAAFTKVADLPHRAGVLTHPYILSRFAYNDHSSPIHRGVFLSRSVLGRALMPPPEAAAPIPPDLHPDLTTRERVVLQTRPEPCQGCHTLINPLGFTLERFDAVGRYREEERGKPIDTSGAYELSTGERVAFGGARDLAEFLAASPQTHEAFVQQLFHHLVKQPLPAYGRATAAELGERFRAGEFDVLALAADCAATAARFGRDAAPSPRRRARF